MGIINNAYENCPTKNEQAIKMKKKFLIIKMSFKSRNIMKYTTAKPNPEKKFALFIVKNLNDIIMYIGIEKLIDITVKNRFAFSSLNFLFIIKSFEISGNKFIKEDTKIISIPNIKFVIFRFILFGR